MFVFESGWTEVTIRQAGIPILKKRGVYTYLLDIVPVWIQQNPTLNFKDRLHALAQDQEQ